MIKQNLQPLNQPLEKPHADVARGADKASGAVMPPVAANANTPAREDEASLAARLAAEALARERLRREREQRRGRARRLWLMLIVFLAGLAALLYARANDVAQLLPGSAHVYRALGVPVSLNPFRVRDLRIRWLEGLEEGEQELAISGRIANTGRTSRLAPRTTFILRDFSGQAIKRWTIPVHKKAREIPAGGTARFHTRIANPPRTAASVDVILSVN